MILLDTCTLLWLASDPGSLSGRARALLAAGAGRLHVSAISAFEIGLKWRTGKLGLPLPPEEWFLLALDAHGIAEVPVDAAIALRSTRLPAIHADPCDRIIIATALDRDFLLLTPDPLIRRYPEVRTQW